MLILCLLCCVFYSHSPPRDLHSFPTRRSSDLVPDRNAARATRRTRRRSPRLARVDGACCSLPSPWHAANRSQALRPGPRSEEHTSELQSLRHLVCRLLLEKKKKKKTTHINIIQ